MEHHVVARRDQVDVVGHHLDLVARLDHGHLGLLAQYLGQHAAMVGGQVLHHDERAAADARHRVEELLEDLQAAGAGTHAHDQVLVLVVVAAFGLFRLDAGSTVVGGLDVAGGFTNVVVHRLAPLKLHAAG